MEKHNTSHGACGKSWRQRGNRTGHCSDCHETFEGITLFDAHRVTISENERGVVRGCKDPETIDVKGFPIKLENGTWRSANPMPDPRTLWPTRP